MTSDKVKKGLEKEGFKPIVVEDEKEKLNYAMQTLEKFYKELNPEQTTLKNNIIYLNSSQGRNDNAYLFELQDLYREASGTHSACINTRTDMTIGSGLVPVIPSPETEEFLNRTNRMGMTMQEIWERLCFDYNLTGMYALQLLYSKEGKIVEVVHNDISTVRAVSPSEKDEIFIPYINEWALSTKWPDIATKHRMNPLNSAILIKNFNPKTWAEDGGRQLLVNRKYSSGMFPYGLPHYQSVIKYIQLDNELAKYHLNKVSGGMFANVILRLSGNPSDEEKMRFKNEFTRKYLGADKSKILFIWSEEDETMDPKIIPFSTNDDAQVFKDLNEMLTQKILTANRIPPELASIPTQNASLGGDANKLAVSHAHVIENVIKPIQKSMLIGINQIMKHNELSEVTVLNEGLKLNQDDVDESGGNPAETN